MKKINSLLLICFLALSYQLSAQITTFPYIEDFETSNGNWSTTGTSSSWAYGVPSGSVISSSAGCGTQAWVTNLSGTYNNSENSQLESPSFDFSGMVNDPILRFDHNYLTESCCDEGWVEISLNGGTTWNKLGTSASGSNWYNDSGNDWWDGSSNGWRVATHVLTGAASNNNVKIRFRVSTDGSVTRDGFAVDNIVVAEVLNDPLAEELIQPGSLSGGFGSAETIETSVTNAGTVAITSIQLCYVVDGGTPVCETFTTNIAPLASDSLTFAVTADLSAGGAHTLDVYVGSANDYVCNDSLSFNLTTIVCQVPNMLTSTVIGADSASIAWTNNSSATSFEIEYGVSGFTLGTGSTIVTSSNPDTLTGLMAATTYDWYVRAICSSIDTSIWSTSGSFFTPCGVITNFPHTESFNTNSTPNCWSETGSESWRYSTSSGYTARSAGDHTGNSGNYAWIDGSFPNGPNQISRLLTEFYDVSSLTTPQLEFFVYSHYASGLPTYNTLEVEMYNGTAWDTLWINQGNLTNRWRRVAVDLSGYNITGNIQFRFSITENGSTAFYNDILLDDITVQEFIPCAAPTALNTTVLNGSSATLSWTETGSAVDWQVEWDTAGTTLGSSFTSNLITINTDTFTTISSLIGESNYIWRVRAICGIGDTSAWTSNQSFVTPCATFIAPFFDGFEAHATLSGLNGTYNCWDAARQNSSNDWNIDASGSTPSSGTGPTAGAYGGTKYLFLETSGGLNGAEATFTSPNIDVSGLTLPMIEFYYHMFGPTINRLYIDVIDGTTTTTVDSIIGQQQLLGTDPWLKKEVFLPTVGSTIRVVLRGVRGNGFTGDISLDDFAVKEAPSCPDPSNPTSANSTSNTADLSWTENGSATTWDIEYGTPGFTPGTGTTISVTSNPYTLTGLSNYTTYEYIVRSSCSATDSSNFTSPTAFFTGLPMSGVYTIDSASTAANNFVSFSNFATIINGVGISGAVTVNVAPGTYNDQLSLGAISGTSATNTVTIDGGSASTATITHDKTIRNSTITLSGTSNLTIQNMTIAATGGSDSWGVFIWKASRDITIDSNVIVLNPGTTGDVAGIVASDSETSDSFSGDNVFDLTISNNTITGGERGMSIYGSFTASARSQNVTIHNNDIQNTDDNGIYLVGYNNVTMTDNNIVNATNNTFNDGIYISDLENFTITGNSAIGGDCGLDADDLNFDNTVTTRSTIANNMFIGGDDGLYLDDIEETDIFHNSLSGADYGIYINDQANLDIRNNIFYSSGGDFSFYYADAATVPFTTFDYNIFYTTSGSIARSLSGNYADVAALQAGLGGNTNSLSGDPVFLSPTSDLHAAGIVANDAGDNTVGITVDYDGDPRPLAPSITVDIGADEFAPPSCAFPGGLSSFGVSATGATLAWVENGTATQWEVEWDTAGFTAGSGRFSSIVTNDTTTITGLMAQTTYDWYVRSICTGSTNSSWSSANSFTTACLTAVAPFNENFDGLALTFPYTALPVCWTPQVGPDFWDVTNGSTNSGFYLAQPADHTSGSGNYMWIDASSDITGNMMETPLIDMSGLTTAYAGFWFASNNTINATNHTINLDAWDGNAWVNVATQSGNFPGWVEVAGNVPAGVPSTAKFRIQAIAASGTTSSTYYQNDLGVDDFFVKEAPLAPISLPITWDNGATVDLTTIDFGGNTSTLVADPTNASNTVLQSIKGANAQVWAGTTFGDSLATAIPFSAGNTTIRAVVYSPTAGVEVRIKVEDKTNPAISVETGVTTTVANGWDTLSFNFSNNAAGTGAINFANTYDKMSIFYNFGVSPTAAETFYVDYVEDVSVNAAPPVPAKAAIALPITWDDTANVNYTVIDFGGNGSALTADPLNASNLVLQSIKGANAQTWGGTTLGDSLSTAIPFSTGNTTIRAVVYSPTVGTPVRLKVEDYDNPAISVETEVLTTVANAWDTLNFDMSTQVMGTAAINFANTYDKMSIFYNFGTSPTAAETYYVDYVEFGNPPAVPTPDPYYPIGTINTEDAATGVADSLNVNCFTSGIVAGVDLDGNAGINFTVIDMASGFQEGIVIFNFIDINNYVVTEGDSIMVHGYVDQYNGLTQIRVDSISVLATGIALPAPIGVTFLDETTEANWLSLTGNWVSLSTSGAFSSNLDLTNGTDTIVMRIDSDTDVNDSLTSSGMPILPGDTICGLLGIGGQFDNSAPRTEGYQIFPMRWSDLTICRLSTGINDTEAVASEFKLVPNPTNGLFEIRSSGFNNATINISIRDISGRLISSEIVNNANGTFTKSFDLNEESAGIYFITIIDGETVINEKLILK